MPTIYLDHNATTPLRGEALAAMEPIWAGAFGNPSSAHAVGRQARRLLEESRERLANLLGALPSEILFTSGATEANNLALFGLPTSPGIVLGSYLEHPCVIEPLNQLAKRGFDVRWLPVNAKGFLELEWIPQHFGSELRLIAAMLANHETGAIQPIRAIAEQFPNIPFHCDAAQAVGKIPVNFRELHVASLSLSAHKFGGPKGIGALILKSGATLKPQQFGGHQQRGQRPGTEPLPLIAGMAAALEASLNELTAHAERVSKLRDRFLFKLAELNPISNTFEPALPNTLNLSFPGCRAEVLLMALDLEGVQCSTGSACSSGSLLPSPVLEAMNVPKALLESALRFSFAPTQSESEIDAAAEVVTRCVRRLRG